MLCRHLALVLFLLTGCEKPKQTITPQINKRLQQILSNKMQQRPSCPLWLLLFCSAGRLQTEVWFFMAAEASGDPQTSAFDDVGSCRSTNIRCEPSESRLTWPWVLRWLSFVTVAVHFKPVCATSETAGKQVNSQTHSQNMCCSRCGLWRNFLKMFLKENTKKRRLNIKNMNSIEQILSPITKSDVYTW